MCKIDHQGMLKFIEEFDVIKERFFYNNNSSVDDSFKQVLRDYYVKNSAKVSYGLEQQMDILRTIHSVYDMEVEKEEQYCDIIYLVREKFLDEYVGIPDLSSLYSPVYFSFEWMMHLEYDNKVHESSYYRDHYIHQIRNLYEMYILLNQLGYWKKCKKIYLSGESKISQLIIEAIVEEFQGMNFKERKLALKLKRDYNYNVKESLIRYIIFSVVYVSALVHDIGYPISYVRRESSKLNEFLPLSNLFLQDDIDVHKIVSLLERSILFQSVDKEEILRRLSKNDHGTLSAIILLERYYDNGEIFKLKPSQRIIIELSALVIYNHTLRYENFGQSQSDRYKPLYYMEPLSYLFRLCDDLQEWDRVYFEISKASSLFICGACKMPRMPLKREDSVGTEYACICEQGKGVNTIGFRYRKTINVDAGQDLNFKEENGELSQVVIEYNKIKLLQMSRYNAKYAVKRAEGLMENKKMLLSQQEFRQVYLDSFITNNPVAIKVEILKDFLYNNDCGEYFKKVRSFDGSFLGELELSGNEIEDIAAIADYMGGVSNKISLYPALESELNKINFAENKKEMVLNRWKNTLFFYQQLMILMGILAKNREKIFLEYIKKDKIDADLNCFFGLLTDKICSNWNITDYNLKILLMDALTQSYCRVDSTTYYNSFNKMTDDPSVLLYLHYLKQREDIVDVVTDYTSAVNYERVREIIKEENGIRDNYYDYYSDYYFFTILCLKEKEDEREQKND